MINTLSLLLLLLLIILINVRSTSNNNIRTLANTNVISYNSKNHFNDNKNKKILKDNNINTIKIVSRLPRSLYIGTYVGIESFIQTAVVMLPIGCILKFGLLKQGLKVWFENGSQLGIEWGTLSAVFSGTESFFANIRQKQDRWNSYIGSGVASASMRLNEGPSSVIKNFAIGFAFMYFIDMLVPSEVPTSIEQTAAHEVSSKIPKTKMVLNKKSLPNNTFYAKKLVKGKTQQKHNGFINFIKKFIT